MEGHGPDILGLRAQQDGQTLLELVGRLIGEGDGNDIPGSGRLHSTQTIRPEGVHFRQLHARGVLQEHHILFGDVIGDLAAVSAGAVLHQVGNTIDQDSGLTAASARQQKQGAFGGQHSFLLHVIEVRKLRCNILPPGSQKSGFKRFIHNAHLSIVV